MSVNAKLSQLTKMWKTVKPASPSFSVVPDGEYVASLESMDIQESKNSGRLQVVSTYKIADGEHEGSIVKRFDGLDNETSIGYFKGYCEIIGMDVPSDISTLQTAMNKFVSDNDDLFNIVVKTKDKYANVYVNGVSDFVKEDEESSDDQEASDESDSEESDDFEVVEEEEDEEEDEEEEEIKPSRVVKPSKPVSKKR